MKQDRTTSVYTQPYKRQVFILRQFIKQTLDLAERILPSHDGILKALLSAKHLLDDEIAYHQMQENPPEPSNAA